MQILFKYLSRDYEDEPYLQLYVTKVLTRLGPDQILFYLPQIFQALTLSRGKIVYKLFWSTLANPPHSPTSSFGFPRSSQSKKETPIIKILACLGSTPT